MAIAHDIDLAKNTGRIPTLGVDHVAFNVPDLEAAIAFFSVAFGCELVTRSGPADYGNGLSVVAAMVRYGGGQQFELLEWRGLGAERPMAGFTDPGGGHLCFAVADLEAALAAVRSLLHVAPAPPRETPDGRRFSRFATPWGLTIQLLTRVAAPAGVGLAASGG
jgi:catechol 2,3-dioxygenase-like lactoylglutathione lyase family enzyme